MHHIELIFDGDCPNADPAREALRQSLATIGQPLKWQEWDRADPGSPAYAQRYGSPTILVDGNDIGGLEPAVAASACRLYQATDGTLTGVPTTAIIIAALRKPSSTRFHWRSLLTAIPGLGAAVLPVGVCPACWPAYAGVLGALGLGSLMKTAYLIPVTGVFLVLALSGLAYRAQHRNGYRPFMLGIVGVLAAMIGKFIADNTVMLYLGMACLTGASVWNSWPQKRKPTASCASCAPQELET